MPSLSQQSVLESKSRLYIHSIRRDHIKSFLSSDSRNSDANQIQQCYKLMVTSNMDQLLITTTAASYHNRFPV